MIRGKNDFSKNFNVTVLSFDQDIAIPYHLKEKIPDFLITANFIRLTFIFLNSV